MRTCLCMYSDQVEVIIIGMVMLMMKKFVTINSWLTLYSFHIECNHWEVLLREAVVHT